MSNLYKIYIKYLICQMHYCQYFQYNIFLYIDFKSIVIYFMKMEEIAISLLIFRQLKHAKDT